MRVNQVALAIAALSLLALLTGCDSFAEYTLINETDQELITWPLLHHCDIGHDGDYLYEDLVMPHSTLHYSDVGLFPEPECVQVATKDRHLVFSEPYKYGGTYIVREPLQPLTDPIPKESDLPRKPFTEAFMEAPVGLSLLLAIATYVSTGVIIGTFMGTRFFYRRYQAQATAISGGILATAGLASGAVWLVLAWWWLTAVFLIDLPIVP